MENPNNFKNLAAETVNLIQEIGKDVKSEKIVRGIGVSIKQKFSAEILEIPKNTPINLVSGNEIGKNMVLKPTPVSQKFHIIGETSKVSYFNMITQLFVNNVIPITVFIALLFLIIFISLNPKVLGYLQELFSNSEYNENGQNKHKSNIDNSTNSTNISASTTTIEEFSTKIILADENKVSPTINRVVKNFIKQRETIDIDSLITDINEFRTLSHQELRELSVTHIQNRAQGFKLVSELTGDYVTVEQKRLLENEGLELKKKILETAKNATLLHDNILVVDKAKKELLKQYRKERKEQREK